MVILAGGQGMRLRQETEVRPKPMITIGERPILWHIMKGFAHHGLRDFIICLGYRGEVIKQYFLEYRVMHRDFTIGFGVNVMTKGSEQPRDVRRTAGASKPTDSMGFDVGIIRADLVRVHFERVHVKEARAIDGDTAEDAIEERAFHFVSETTFATRLQKAMVPEH